jgi:hypothetical protein
MVSLPPPTAFTSTRERHPITLALFSLLLFACACGILYESPTSAQQQQKTTDTAQPAQKTFPSAQAAADVFVQAAESSDMAALNQILGPHGEDLVSSEDPVRDKNIVAHFSAEAHEKTLVSLDPKNPNRASLVVGNDDWPMPIPIDKRNGVWLFDTKSGKQDMLDRRIGANELEAIQICRAAPLGKMDFVIEGAMIGGFALAALAAHERQLANPIFGRARSFLTPIEDLFRSSEYLWLGLNGEVENLHW